MFDLVIDIENTPGSLSKAAAAISDAGVNLASATCLGSSKRAELHILVPHPEAAKHVLAISSLTVTRRARWSWSTLRTIQACWPI